MERLVWGCREGTCPLGRLHLIDRVDGTDRALWVGCQVHGVMDWDQEEWGGVTGGGPEVGTLMVIGWTGLTYEGY